MLNLPLFQCQKEGIEFILRRGGSGGLFHEMGLGKTRTALEIYTANRARTRGLKLLVIGEAGSVGPTWTTEVQAHTPYVTFNCRKKDPTKQDLEQADIFLINYEQLIAKPLEKDVDVAHRVTKKEQLGKMRDLVTLSAILRDYPFMITADESSRMRSHKSQTTAALFHLRDRALHQLVLTGTPAPNGPHEYWAQMEFVKPGIFNRSFYQFQREFFHLERQAGNRLTGIRTEKLENDMIPYSADGLRTAFSKGWKWAIDKKSEERLMAVVSTAAHFALKKDYLDLPEENDEIREVELGPKQRRAYRDMNRHLITEISERHITGEVALKKFMKLREIASGFAIDDLRMNVPIGENAKLKELHKVISEIAHDQQVIVWGHFRWEMEQVREALNAEYGPGTARIYGEDDDNDQTIYDFLHGRFRILVAHPLAAGKGLNLTNCNVQIFFSLSYSWDQYHQARSRIHRSGQKRACTFVHLLAKDTIDARLLEVLKTKQRTEAILYGIAQAEQKQEAHRNEG